MTGLRTWPPESAGGGVERLQRRLSRAGIDVPRLEARLLVAHALDCEPSEVLARPEQAMSASELRRLEKLEWRRRRREPMAHILGTREFWSLPFKVTRETLIPRPESETVVEAVLARTADRRRAITILDLGTGSGCLLLALLHELPRARGLGVDSSAAALDVARANARALGLDGRARFQRGDWTTGLRERFHMIVANPPYVPQETIDTLAPEVSRFETRVALDGGPDGLGAYRAIVPGLAPRLRQGGRVFLEIGADQSTGVGSLLHRHGFRILEVARDLGGRERCIIAYAARSTST